MPNDIQQESQSTPTPNEAPVIPSSLSAEEYQAMQKRAHEIAAGLTANAPKTEEPLSQGGEAVAPPPMISPEQTIPTETPQNNPTTLPTDTELDPVLVDQQMKEISHHSETDPSVNVEKQSFTIVDTINSMIEKSMKEIREHQTIIQEKEADVHGLELLKTEAQNPNPDNLLHLGRQLANRNSPDEKAA